MDKKDHVIQWLGTGRSYLMSRWCEECGGQIEVTGREPHTILSPAQIAAKRRCSRACSQRAASRRYIERRKAHTLAVRAEMERFIKQHTASQFSGPRYGF
jgi:hypothetical protein